MRAIMSLDKNWIARTELSAAGLIRYDHQTLITWRDDSCPFLGGRRLRSRRHPGHPQAHLYWKPDVLLIAEARTQPPAEEFDEGGFRWMGAKLAARRFRIANKTLNRYTQEGHPGLGGQ